MRFLNNFFLGIKSKLSNQKTDSFAGFFLHASDQEKKRVFEDAARRANTDQRELVKHVNKLGHKAT